jgi:glycosidase
MENWADKFFYHIYPLGICGCPKNNDFYSPAGNGLSSLTEHIPELLQLGVNALYIGPLFESSSHGYDTVDYYHVDRRLGSNEDFKKLVKTMHDNGISVVVDAVFNHTGRDFFAFKNIKEKREHSQYVNWYLNMDFSKNNECNDGFSYEGWAGHNSLVKLNLGTSDVREYIFGIIKYWIEEFNIDGLRLDAANVMSVDFLQELSLFSKKLKNPFWLLGEIVVGDYRRLANENCLDSVTNYELHKSLWSAFSDQNMYELSWTLKREFENGSPYAGLAFYNFLDNHDVNRVASTLRNPASLFPLYGALFCVPGIPSIYYGSEYGISGRRSEYSDYDLRPAWDNNWANSETAKSLFREICRFSKIRSESEALKYGNYCELSINYDDVFAFSRETPNEKIIVILNPFNKKIESRLKTENAKWTDLLSGENFISGNNILKIDTEAFWLRILKKSITPA